MHKITLNNLFLNKCRIIVVIGLVKHLKLFCTDASMVLVVLPNLLFF